jgi:hypothetical protein
LEYPLPSNNDSSIEDTLVAPEKKQETTAPVEFKPEFKDFKPEATETKDTEKSIEINDLDKDYDKTFDIPAFLRGGRKK